MAAVATNLIMVFNAPVLAALVERRGGDLCAKRDRLLQGRASSHSGVLDDHSQVARNELILRPLLSGETARQWGLGGRK